MNKQQLLSAAVGLQILIGVGCGKKEAAAPPENPANTANQKSVADLVATPADNGAPPPPAAPAPESAPAATTTPAAEPVTPPVQPANSAASGFTGGTQQQFQRNMNWVTRIGGGDPEQKRKALDEIRNAHLSAADMQALQQMAQYYGIKL
jgi:hypothetical protein